MGLGFGSKYHKNIIDNASHGNAICTDYTSVFTGKFAEKGTKWNSYCNLSTVMNQLQEFFAKPGLSKDKLPSKEELKRLRDHAKDYKIHVKVNHEGLGSYIVTHSYNNRFPPLANLAEKKETVPLKISKENEEENVVKPSQSKSSTSDDSSSTSSSHGKSKDEYREVSVDRTKVASKLACSVNKVNIFDASKPVLGYMVRLDKDSNTGKMAPVIKLKLVSVEVFKAEAEESKVKIYWLPIFGKKEDFRERRKYILEAIAKIYAGMKGEKEVKFEARMALKVLLPLLVKTLGHFYNEIAQGNAGSNASLEVFCQLYYLLGKLVEDRKALMENVDKEVESFLTKEEKRHKKHSGDLNEFILKMSLSYSSLENPETMNLILKEYLARNVSTVMKKDKSFYFERNCFNLTERFLGLTRESNEFFLFTVAVCKMMAGSTVRKGLEARFGLVSDEMVKELRTTGIWIQKNLKSKWDVFVDGLDQREFVYNDLVMENYVLRAFNSAKNKGYLD